MPTTSPSTHEARFDPKLKLYLYLTGLAFLAATVVGALALPIWIFAGLWWARRYYEVLSCTVHERNLVVKKGVQFRVEKTIPLDQIQDVSVRHGPILNRLGLAKLVVETAGHGASQSAAASLIGIVDAVAFRDRILEQREHAQRLTRLAADAAPARSGDVELAPLLREIRDAVLRLADASAGRGTQR